MSPIAHLRGTVAERGPDWLIVEVGGLGLRVYVPSSTLAAVGAPGDRVALHTHLQVREDGLALYGFASADDLRLFELLIGVSGVGPRLALALLSALPSDQLAAAIAQGDAPRLTSVPGVGRRTAERLVLELRDKLQEYAALAAAPVAGRDADVVAALMGLGYSRAEAEAAAAGLPADPSLATEERIRLALQHFAGR